MSMKKCILAVVVMGALVALLGVRKSRETLDSHDAVPGSSVGSPQSGSSGSKIAAAPTKTKVDRSRAVIPRTSEQVEESLKKKALNILAVNHARQIGQGLFEFENKFGAFPNDETGAATANDYFYQLVVANIVLAPSIFTWVESEQAPNPVGLENCGFPYLYGMTSAGNPSRPLVVAPLVRGKRIFDRKVFGGKAVILRVDNSVTTLDIEQDGTVIVNGMDLFDPAQPF